MDAFISPNDTGGVMKQVDSSAVVDNIFVFTDGTDKFQWANNRKGIYPLSQAKILAGDSADKTSILQAVLNHTDIKVVELDAQQIITISGTLNCNGKVIQFTKGAKFTGTATINNAVILGEDDDQLFDTGITLTNSKSGKSYFSAKWYGALGNDANNDTAALQKVLDTCVYNQTKKVFIPAGKYRIDKGIYLRKDADANGLTEFVQNITIEGPVSPYSGSDTEACIVSSNVNSFALGLQKVKGCRIKNISIAGPNTALQSLSLYDVIQNESTNFSAGMRDTSLSPNAGIVVDPFSNSVCPSKYPDFTSFYTEESRGGSTDIVIENVIIRTFVVGYLISPTAFLQNAERIVIRDCWGDFCKAAVAVGQSQTRNVYVENFGCWGGTETVFDSRSYGEATGCPPDVDGLNIAGGVRYLCRLNNWISNGMHITNMHAELLGSLGGNFTTMLGKLTIRDSFIDLIGATDHDSNPPAGPSIQPVRTQFQGDSLVMENCFLSQYSAAQSFPMNFTVNRAGFYSCTFNYIPVASGLVAANQIMFDNCTTTSSAFAFGDGQIIYGSAPANRANIPFLFTTNMEWRTGLQVSQGLKRVKKDNIMYSKGWGQAKDVRLVPLNAGITLSSIDQDSLEAVFNLSGYPEFFKSLQVDDILVANTSDGFGNTACYISLGKVISKNTSTGDVTIKYIMRGADLLTTYYLFIYKPELLIAPLIIGDLTSGTNTITNVLLENTATSLPIGTMINHKYLPDGTYIAGYNNSTHIITLSNIATGTAEEQSFVSSDWEAQEMGAPYTANPYNIGYKIGDKIINNDFITYPDVLYWTCTKSGITNTAVLPVFVATNM